MMQMARLAEFVQRDDIGMAQSRQSPRFTIKALAETCLAAIRAGQDFQRDHSVQCWLARFIDGAHAAGVEQAKNLKLREKILNLLHGRRLESKGLPFFGCIRLSALREQAGWAKPGQCRTR